MNYATLLTTTPARRAPQPLFGSFPGWAVFAGLLWGLGTGQPAAGQTTAPPPDSSRVSYGEENATALPMPTVGRFKRRYSQLVLLQVEEQRLWKLGLNNFLFGVSGDKLSSFQIGVHLIHERKLLRAPWSVMAELSPSVLRYGDVNYTNTWNTYFIVNSQLAARYYYSLRRRIRKGKSANNFSANYLSLALGSSVGRQSTETPFNYYDAGAAVRLDGAVLYGLQRRLGRYGFVDFNFGVPFRLLSGKNAPSYTSANFTATLRIGFALGR